jgi:hypothetical protein
MVKTAINKLRRLIKMGDVSIYLTRLQEIFNISGTKGVRRIVCVYQAVWHEKVGTWENSEPTEQIKRMIGMPEALPGANSLSLRRSTNLSGRSLCL